MRDRCGILGYMVGSITPCLFCGATGRKLTREHVYPQWLRRAMNIHSEITIRSEDETVRVMPELDIQLRDVCETCNNGWLHDLERAFRASMLWSLHGFPMTMPRELQRVAAVWAVKTWLLIERALAYTRPGQALPEIPQDYFGWLHEHSEPPEPTQVWIGAVDALSAPPGDQVISFLATQWVGTPPDLPVGLLGVFTIGDLVFAIYNPVRTRTELPPQGLGIGGRLGPFLTQIWPHQIEEVGWPPAGVFAPDDLRRVWPGGGYIRPGAPPDEGPQPP